MISLNPKDLPQPKVQGLLLGGVAPRPIALVSTLSSDGVKNISPFSFFNAFGSNPPIVAFSASRRGTDSTLKDTYNNLVQSGECVINAVTYSMVEQINLASCEYGPDVDEFLKAGFTAVDSLMVKPKRVAESPFQMECILRDMISYGEGPGSANLAVCEVVMFHISEAVWVENKISTKLVDHVARNGEDIYTRAFGHSLFRVPKPGSRKGIGFDGLPQFMKLSHVFSANNLARFAFSESIPDRQSVIDTINSYEVLDSGELAFGNYLMSNIKSEIIGSAVYLSKNHFKKTYFLEVAAKHFLETGDSDTAWLLAIYKGIVSNEY